MEPHVGLFLALLGTFSASTGNMVHQRNLNNNFSLIPTLAYSMLYGSLVTLLITQIKGTELLFEYSFSYIASLAYLSIVGSIFAFIFYLKIIRESWSWTSWLCRGCYARTCFINLNRI